MYFVFVSIFVFVFVLYFVSVFVFVFSQVCFSADCRWCLVTGHHPIATPFLLPLREHFLLFHCMFWMSHILHIVWYVYHILSKCYFYHKHIVCFCVSYIVAIIYHMLGNRHNTILLNILAYLMISSCAMFATWNLLATSSYWCIWICWEFRYFNIWILVYFVSGNRLKTVSCKIITDCHPLILAAYYVIN